MNCAFHKIKKGEEMKREDEITRLILTWGYDTIGDLSNGIPFNTISSLSKYLADNIEFSDMLKFAKAIGSAFNSNNSDLMSDRY